jgi:exosome complex RNA-binding protein Rrp42 (RNase PH superfamily)
MRSGPRQIVDPNREEEALAHALVSVTVDDRDRLLGALPLESETQLLGTYAMTAC